MSRKPWYNVGVHDAIMDLKDEYPNAPIVGIFGGALYSYDLVNCAYPDFERFAVRIADAVRAAEFHNWHEDAATVAERFCRLCNVDPMLVECYIGVHFCDLFS